MNKEVIKAMNKKPTKPNAIKTWWGQNGYKVWRVILFPLWWSYKLHKYINKKLNDNTPWDEARADEILNYYIPRRARWKGEKQTFYFFDNGYGWESKYHKKYIKLKDRRFWNLYACVFGGKIRDYLIHNFELEGFTKKVGSCYDYDTDIAFIKKEG